MLIHITPKLMIDADLGGLFVGPAHIARVDIPELGMSLHGRADITARKPYPNKNWLVACRKKGWKAINGLFIETSEPIRRFTVLSNWTVDEGLDLTHIVHYTVADSDFCAVSSNMLLWGYRRNALAPKPSGSPLALEPCMEMTQGIARHPRPDDTFASPGSCFISYRVEYFEMPTIDRAWLTQGKETCEHSSRLPSVADAFSAQCSALRKS